VTYFLFVLNTKRNKNFNPTTGGNQEPNMLPPACRATPAFGSGHRAGTAQRVFTLWSLRFLAFAIFEKHNRAQS
jgi:hypothetical protein